MRVLKNALIALPILGMLLGLVAANHGWAIAHALAIGTLAAAGFLLLFIRALKRVEFFPGLHSQMSGGLVIAGGAGAAAVAELLGNGVASAIVTWVVLFGIFGYLFYQARRAGRNRRAAQ